MKDIRKRLYIVLGAICLVVMAGSSGYYILFGGKPKIMDCLYMTVISLTSVGYGEVLDVTGNTAAQIFTMVLIVFGMGIILYGISTLTALLIEGELSGILRKKQMKKRIGRLCGHYIVCGGGETGRHVLLELVKNGETVVLIEQSQEQIDRCNSCDDLLFIQGDATDDENLMAAGIERAAGIIISLPSDKDTLYVTMTARMLNKSIRIISRMIDNKLELKLKKAGADGMVSPNLIGGLRMASEMLRPTVVDFLDSMLRSNQGNLRIHEIKICELSGLVGRTLRDSGFKEKYNLLVMAVKNGDGEIEFNPAPSKMLTNGQTLIVMGEVKNITRAKHAT